MATVESGISASSLLEQLGVEASRVDEGDLVARTPITGEEIGRVARITGGVALVTIDVQSDGSTVAAGAATSLLLATGGSS